MSLRNGQNVRNCGTPDWKTCRKSQSPCPAQRAGDQSVAAYNDLVRDVRSIPVPLGQKMPDRTGWQELRMDTRELSSAFEGVSLNRGRLLGEPSRGLVDCDLDSREAVKLAPSFLPSTDEIHGRAGNPCSHYWYRVKEGSLKTIKFQDENGKMIVELRGNGAQTIVPPSVHDSGEQYVWYRNGLPADIEAQELISAVSRLASAALILRHYPDGGGRHEFVLALAGTLLKGGLSEEQTIDFIESISTAAGDEEQSDRLRAIRDTADNCKNGNLVSGAGKLAELLGPDGAKIIGLVEKWMKLRRIGRFGSSSTVSIAEALSALESLGRQAAQEPDQFVARILSERASLDQVVTVASQDSARYEAWILNLATAKVPAKDLAVLKKEVSAARRKQEPTSTAPIDPYTVTADGIFEHGPYGGTKQLANFTAKITREIIEDDGVEQTRAVKLEVRMREKQFECLVSIADFKSGNWILNELGVGAILAPGVNVADRVRYVAQRESGEVPSSRVYTHTGWRQINDTWFYLHGDGAIGPDGPVPSDIEVRLPKNLVRYRLPVPPTATLERQNMVRRYLGLRCVAKSRISVVLLGALYRSVIDQCDFAIHLTGQTGCGKSELAALIQQHFGAEMDARRLPASWSGTANSLESSAFFVKDAVLTVDDFCPSGTKNDIDKLNQTAERLIRSQGNNSGRQRLQANLELRPPRPPRGLILSTGEDVFRGHSLRARTLILEVDPDSVDFEHLTSCQRAARDETYATVMAAFLQWLAPNLESIRSELAAAVRANREESNREGHRRTTDIETHVLFGWKTFLKFAMGIGAISSDEVMKSLEGGRSAIAETIERQKNLQSESDPVDRFLELLRAGFLSGKCHLVPIEDTKPSKHWGWTSSQAGRDLIPQGEKIGWVDQNRDVYLIPETAYQVGHKLARDAGENLSLSQKTLCKRLRDRGLLKTFDADRDRVLVRRVISGRRVYAMHLSAETLQPSEDGFKEE